MTGALRRARISDEMKVPGSGGDVFAGALRREGFFGGEETHTRYSNLGSAAGIFFEKGISWELVQIFCVWGCVFKNRNYVTIFLIQRDGNMREEEGRRGRGEGIPCGVQELTEILSRKFMKTIAEARSVRRRSAAAVTLSGSIGPHAFWAQRGLRDTCS